MFLFFSSDFDCQSLFLLPSHVLYKTVTLLISGAAIDRDENKVIHLLIIIIIIIIIIYYYLFIRRVVFIHSCIRGYNY